MQYLASEIIATEVSSWDNTIRFYKKCVEFLRDIELYFSTREPINNLEHLLSEFRKQLQVYEKIYEIIGDSTKVFLSNLGVPDNNLILQLSSHSSKDITDSIHRSLYFESDHREDTKTKTENETTYVRLTTVQINTIMCHALINLICCEQFFKLCQLRQKAQTNYLILNELIKNGLESLPKSFHGTFSNKYKFEGQEGFEICGAAIVQRFVKYQLFGKELLKLLPEDRTHDISLDYLESMAHLLIKLGASYATWDNKARLITEKADPHKKLKYGDPYDDLVIQQKKLIKDRDEVESSIAALKILLSEAISTSVFSNEDQGNDDLIKGFNLKLAALELLAENQKENIDQLSKKMSSIIRSQITEAKMTEENIKFIRSEAAVLVQGFYKQFKLPIMSFERDIPKCIPYLPKLTLSNEKESENLSPPLSPRSPRSPRIFQFKPRSQTCFTSDVGCSSPDHSPKKSKWDHLKGGIKNLGTSPVSPRKQRAETSPSKETTHLKQDISLPFQRTTPIAIPTHKQNGQSTSLIQGSTQNRQKEPSIAQRYLIQAKQQQSEIRKAVPCEELGFRSQVKDKIVKLEKDLDEITRRLKASEVQQDAFDKRLNKFTLQKSTNVSNHFGMFKKEEPSERPRARTASVYKRQLRLEKTVNLKEKDNGSPSISKN